ncbi:MAG: MBL fold metallo-hydrolase [Candidatus Thermoplasmatota archaeon]
MKDTQITAQFLGGGNEVGRAALTLEIEEKRFLIEYGMLPGKPPEYPLPPPPVDLTLLTHAHLDHSGMIPWLCSHTDQNILCTKLTAALSDLLFKDTIKIAKMDGYSPPFSPADIKEVEHSIIPISIGEKRRVSDCCEIMCHSAGHIPGSLMYEINAEKRILFTGDFNVSDTRLMRGTKPVPCDILIMESTYAERDHPNRQELEQAFLDKIDEVVSRGGVAIIPAFAVARSQEIAMVLHKASYNVWFDGMGKKVAKLFLKYPNELRSAENLKKAMNKLNFVHSDHGRKLALKSEVILTSSGMMDGGPVLSYMNKLKNDKKNAVLLTGYQVPGSNSRLLVDHGKLDFYGVQENVECEVQYFDFSAHAGHRELIEFAKKCHPEKIVLFHGDNREALREPLQNIGDVLTPTNGEIFYL